MNPEIEKKYEELFDVFAMPGWATIVAEATIRRNTYLNTMLNPETTSDTMLMFKGAIKEAEIIINAEEATKMGFDMAQEHAESEFSQD